jgi:alpha-galactosidase
MNKSNAKKGSTGIFARKHVVLLITGALGATLAGQASAQLNGTGARPFMGWSTWSQQDHFGNSEASGDGFQNEVNVKANSDAMRQSGLTAHGFKYINLDGDWDNGNLCQCGGPTTFDTWGRPVANVVRFPHGLFALAAHIHYNGQKIGIYWENGVAPAIYAANTPILGSTHTVQEIVSQPLVADNNGFYQIDYTKPGAMEYTTSIVSLFAEWGIDYLKMDFTQVGTAPYGQNLPIDHRPSIQAYAQAIAAVGRPMYLNLSFAQNHDYASWWQTWSNGRRIDGDIECSRRSCSTTLTQWSNVLERFTDLIPWTTNAGVRRGWNDLDSLEVGNGTNAVYPANSPEILIDSDPAPTAAVSITTSPAFVDGLTNDERQTAMTLWSIGNAPLQLGDDLTLLDSFGIQLLTNDEAIAVDQSGRPGNVVLEGNTPVWAQNLCDGTYYVALFNLNDSATQVSVNWTNLGFTGTASVRDLWAHQNLGNLSTGYTATLNAHASALLHVTPPPAARLDRNICEANTGAPSN